jgi:hypothetical protein
VFAAQHAVPVSQITLPSLSISSFSQLNFEFVELGHDSPSSTFPLEVDRMDSHCT